MSQQSFHQQTANGSNIAFTITTFSEDEIKVYVDGVESTNGGSSQNDYTIPNYTTSGGTVTWNTSGSLTAPASPSVVRVVRQTDVMNNGNTAVEGKAVYTAGSSVKAEDLNNNTKQALRAIKENQEQLIQSYDFEPQAVNTAAIKDLNVTRAKLANDAIDGTKIADDSIDSEHFAAGSIDLEHMSANSIDSDQYVDGSIDRVHLEADIIDSTKLADNSVNSEHLVVGSIDHVHLANDVIDGDNIQDDVINSEHYVAQSIDTEHIALENITTALIAPDAVTSAKIADDQINSEHYVAGSIDHEHLANDIIDGDNIQDDVINSEHYVAGSIDHEHLANDIIDGDNIQDSVINSEHYVDGSIDREHLAADIVDGTKIADDSIDNEHIAANAVRVNEIKDGEITSAKLNAATVITSSEQASATTNDTSFLTSAAADARFFNISTGDTIKDGDTFPDNDTTIATTAAINDRIIDLVDDVGGFVPIANETSFPTANPDVNNGSGTLVSIKAIASTRTPSSGTVTIANGAGSGNTVTITGCGSTVLTAGFGVIVETTTTLHTYAFHRLVPKATEVTTVAGIASNITTVANNTSNINAVAADASDIGIVAADGTDIGLVAGSISNVNTVAGDISNVNAVAGNATNINAVAANNSNITSVAGNASNINSAVSNASNINSAVSNASNINTVAGSISNVNTTAGSIANVNTTASNIANVNNFAATYQIASSAPSTDGAGNALAAGDLYFDTSANELRVHNGSTFQGGVTATGNLAGLGANTFTGNQTITNNEPKLILNDTGDNPDYEVKNQDGTFVIRDSTNSADRLFINTDGHTDIKGNLDCEAGLDVTGNITVTGNVDGRDVAADGTKLDGIETGATADQTGSEVNSLLSSLTITGSNLNLTSSTPTVQFNSSSNNPDYMIQNQSGKLIFNDTSSAVNRLVINTDGHVDVTGDLDVGGELEVTGHSYLENLTLTASTPSINFLDNGTDPDFMIQNQNGKLIFQDTTNSVNRLVINTDGHVDVAGNLDVGSGIDVTGNVTASGNLSCAAGTLTGNLTLSSHHPKLIFTDTDNNPDFQIIGNHGALLFYDSTNARNALNIDSSGNIQVSGTVDGVDIATRDSLFGALTSVSGVLTNGVQAATQSASDNSTKVATTAYVETAISNLVDSSPGALNTLNELAAAIGDDANFSTTITNSIATKMPLAGGTFTGNVVCNNNLTLNDSSNSGNGRVRFGDNSDLQIYHDGSHSRIADGGTGDLIMMTSRLQVNNAADDEAMINAVQDGAVELYHNGTKKFETYQYGVNIAGTAKIESGGNFHAHDNIKFIAGTGEDLHIFHDGSNSRIADAGTGYLIQTSNGDGILLQSSNGQNLAKFLTGGAAELYHNYSKKLETTSSGATITGTCTATAFSGDGSGLTGLASDSISEGNSTAEVLDTGSNGIFRFLPEGSEKFRIDNNGKLGILTTNPQEDIHIGASGGDVVRKVRIDGTNNSSGGQVHRFVLENYGPSALVRLKVSAADATEVTALTINHVNRNFFFHSENSSGNNGRVYTNRADSNQTVLEVNQNNGSGSEMITFRNGGTQLGTIHQSGSGVSYQSQSDYRLKENDVVISDGIARLKLLRPIRFNWKVDTETVVDGFYAHEVSAAVPEAVRGQKDEVFDTDGVGTQKKGDPKYQQLEQSKLIPLITAALQEAVNKIETLETKVATLEAA